MKKYNQLELLGIGVILLLICIIFSLIGKHVFDLDGDYLSAAATLFASVIAFILFNDWKDQFLITKFEKYSDEIESLSKQLRGELHELFYFLLRSDDYSNKLTLSKFKEVRRTLQQLHQTFLIYIYFLDNFEKKDINEYKAQVNYLRDDIQFCNEWVSRINRIEEEKDKIEGFKHINLKKN
ncbi:hypothetical protein [Acinetobacter baumannii]|uniref:hypothetical protein n=1 Tax=Acinetobacter baumannii TaxID=470 RepID=UPI0021C1C48B|nr:hypothetical protein [Acinetobacter baumannii]MDA5807174.1 hypothetical protein [Acinetobacter baumannii]